LGWCGDSVLVGAHDGEHARRNAWVRGVFRTAVHIEGVVVDLPEVRLALDFDAAEVVLAVRVIVLREIAEGLNREDEASPNVEGKVRDPSRHDDLAADEGAAEIVVEKADAAYVVDVFGAHTNTRSTKAEATAPPLMSPLPRAGDRGQPRSFG